MVLHNINKKEITRPLGLLKKLILINNGFKAHKIRVINFKTPKTKATVSAVVFVLP